MSFRKTRSFTLIEVMVVAGVILVSALALFGVYVSALTLAVQAKEKLIATDDLEDTLEYIKTLPFAHITDITNGGFAQGSTVDENIIGGFLLDDEQITIIYPQGVDVDPLEIQVQISWTGRYGRSNQQIFKTLRSSGL